jgi:hypothetical protein
MKPLGLPLPPPSRPRPRAELALRARLGAGTIGELARALARGGRWWMVPMLAVLALCALLLSAVAAIEYVAPFVYTIF